MEISEGFCYFTLETCSTMLPLNQKVFINSSGHYILTNFIFFILHEVVLVFYFITFADYLKVFFTKLLFSQICLRCSPQ